MTGLGTLTAAAFWLASIGVHLATLLAAMAQPIVRRRSRHRIDRPPVSVILPVHRVTHVLEEGLESVFAQAGAQVEILVAGKEADQPVLDAIDRVAARHPAVRWQLIRSTREGARSPKVDNISGAIAAASHDVLILKDDNMLLQPGQIDQLVGELVEGVGMVVATPFVMRTAGLGGEIERAFINPHASRWLLTGSTLGQGFGIGKLFAFRRSDFERAGGIEAISHTIAEDHALTKAYRAIALRTVMAEQPGFQALGRRTILEAWQRQVRWAVCRRLEEPLALVGEFVSSHAVAAVMAWFAAPLLGVSGWQLVLATVIVWLVGDLMFNLGKRLPMNWMTPIAGLIRDIMLPAIILLGFTTNEVEWGGQKRDATIKREGEA